MTKRVGFSQETTGRKSGSVTHCAYGLGQMYSTSLGLISSSVTEAAAFGPKQVRNERHRPLGGEIPSRLTATGHTLSPAEGNQWHQGRRRRSLFCGRIIPQPHSRLLGAPCP